VGWTADELMVQTQILSNTNVRIWNLTQVRNCLIPSRGMVFHSLPGCPESLWGL